MTRNMYLVFKQFNVKYPPIGMYAIRPLGPTLKTSGLGPLTDIKPEHAWLQLIIVIPGSSVGQLIQLGCVV